MSIKFIQLHRLHEELGSSLWAQSGQWLGLVLLIWPVNPMCMVGLCRCHTQHAPRTSSTWGPLHAVRGASLRPISSTTDWIIGLPGPYFDT